MYQHMSTTFILLLGLTLTHGLNIPEPRDFVQEAQANLHEIDRCVYEAEQADMILFQLKSELIDNEIDQLNNELQQTFADIDTVDRRRSAVQLRGSTGGHFEWKC